MKIAFVCVNYDGFHYTKKMIISLLKQTALEVFVDISICVVDNSPKADSSLVDYCELHSSVKYIRSDSNDGYFAGLNLGIRSLSTNKFDYVIVCNNDLEFCSEFCLNLTKLIAGVKTQIICPDVITLDGVHQNPHHLNALSKMEVFAFDCYFSNYYIALGLLKLKSWLKKAKLTNKAIIKEYQDNIEINQGVGACYVLTPLFFDNHQELFFPSFLYGEEATLSWQVRSSGGQLVYNNTLLVNHAESATLSKLPARQTYEFGKKSYWIIRKYLF